MSDISIPQPMRTHARVENGVVCELLTTDLDPANLFVATISWVDVTDVSPVPALGWTYAADTGAFAAPVVVPVTVIPAAQFLARFTDAERTTIVTAGISTPAILGWFIGLSAAGATVDVTSADLKTTMNALVTAGALTAARAAAVMEAA